MTLDDNDERPSELFVNTCWDTASVIVYALGLVALDYILKYIPKEDLPLVAVMTLFAFKWAFLLVAVGVGIRTLIRIIRNLIALNRELRWDKIRGALVGNENVPGRVQLWRLVRRALAVSLAIFVCVAAVLFMSSWLLVSVILAILILAVLALVPMYHAPAALFAGPVVRIIAGAVLLGLVLVPISLSLDVTSIDVIRVLTDLLYVF